jgi:ABC-type glycerol-3-phosphate transport system substrate-binding protein
MVVKRSIKLVCITLVFLLCGGVLMADKKEEEKTLVIWWWGETELQGLTGWLDETITIFEEKHPNVTVEATLQDTVNVFSDFPTASAAGEPPDLQFSWNGIYAMEWVWLGHVEPLDNLIPKNELKSMVATPLSSFEGKQYRAGWYLFGHGWVYNKDLFKRAGVPDRLSPPETWDEWLQVCQMLKDAGITPISLGAKDQLLGDWLISLFMVQQLDSPSDPLKLCIGDLRWDDPRYYEHWVRIKELWDEGYINDDVNSLDLYQGQDLFTKGEAAMTIAVGTIIPAMQKTLGTENIAQESSPRKTSPTFRVYSYLHSRKTRNSPRSSYSSCIEMTDTTPCGMIWVRFLPMIDSMQVRSTTP